MFEIKATPLALDEPVVGCYAILKGADVGDVAGRLRRLKATFVVAESGGLVRLVVLGPRPDFLTEFRALKSIDLTRPRDDIARTAGALAGGQWSHLTSKT